MPFHSRCNHKLDEKLLNLTLQHFRKGFFTINPVSLIVELDVMGVVGRLGSEGWGRKI